MSRARSSSSAAGISGLAAAWELSGGAADRRESTPRIEVIEASAHVGGSLATTTFAGRTIDLGADGFLARRPEAVDTRRRARPCWRARGDQCASGAWLWSRGALHELPKGLVLGVPTEPRGDCSVRRTLVARRASRRVVTRTSRRASARRGRRHDRRDRAHEARSRAELPTSSSR